MLWLSKDHFRQKVQLKSVVLEGRAGFVNKSV